MSDSFFAPEEARKKAGGDASASCSSETSLSPHFSRLDLPRRMRRSRQNTWSRRLRQETVLTVKDLIWPVFVTEGEGREEPVVALPGVMRWSPDLLIEKLRYAAALGIPAVALFPVIPSSRRDPQAREALRPDNLLCRACRLLKEAVPDIGLIVDIALDPYTSHGQDGILNEKGQICNDATVSMLAQQAVLLARAGADIVAPSDMMDGRVKALRQALDSENLTEVQIMAYAAKYASVFYGPFREAIGTQAVAGDLKKTYQMDPANTDEALWEARLDLEEGADSLLVKPGIFYLDIVARLKQAFYAPVYAYQVSGEYALLAAGIEKGLFPKEAALYESLLAFKRAGADGIFTYSACTVAKLLAQRCGA